MYHKTKYEKTPIHTTPKYKLKKIISHLYIDQLSKIKKHTLKIVIVIDNIKNEIHHFIVLLLDLKNLELPLPPNWEYFPKNKDLNQCIVIFIFAARNQRTKINGNKI